jgi:hypothetical protein
MGESQCHASHYINYAIPHSTHSGKDNMEETVHESGRRIKEKGMFVSELSAKPEANYVKEKHWQNAQYLKISCMIT